MQTDPIKRLRRLQESGQHNDVVQMIRDRDSVLAGYGPVFREPEGLDPETLSEFLRFEHNRHWWNLHRREDRLMGSFELVRDVLGELVDESRPIVDRVDVTVEVPGLDSDLYSAILVVAYPERHGVWSGISESAMRRLDLWPEVGEEASEGEAYAVVDEMLATIAAELDVDLWTLDALWWGVEKEHDPARHFVARTRSRPARPARSRASAPTSTARRSEPETFMCSICFATKPLRLQSSTPGVCVDCD